MGNPAGAGRGAGVCNGTLLLLVIDGKPAVPADHGAPFSCLVSGRLFFAEILLAYSIAEFVELFRSAQSQNGHRSTGWSFSAIP
ncbi:MAG TPA: hypothetical protein PLO06_08810 [Methanoregulaceae archaeon]|nr:hypothetical protein [Methanoregulaceae archaeon]HPD75946.1 hypothetical protein [Methanoregulaceae archaeon]